MTQVRFRVDFATGCSIGPGKVELLESIERTGSLRQAARGLKMSDRRAWLLLDQLIIPSLRRSRPPPWAGWAVGERH